MEYLRLAARQDLDVLYQWVNEASVRRNAFSRDIISYEEHKKWFESIMRRTDVRQYIYICDEIPIGQIRVNIWGEKAEIDYSICIEKRGMGYGERMVAQLMQRVKNDFPHVKKLVAKVKTENIVSQKVFLKNGFMVQYQCYELEIG